MLRPEELRNMIMAFVVAMILIVSGFVAVNITYGMGLYVYSEVNKTIQQPMLIDAAKIQIVGLALMIAGIVIVVVAIGIMIRAMISSATEAASS